MIILDGLSKEEKRARFACFPSTVGLTYWAADFEPCTFDKKHMLNCEEVLEYLATRPGIKAPENEEELNANYRDRLQLDEGKRIDEHELPRSFLERFNITDSTVTAPYDNEPRADAKKNQWSAVEFYRAYMQKQEEEEDEKADGAAQEESKEDGQRGDGEDKEEEEEEDGDEDDKDEDYNEQQAAAAAAAARPRRRVATKSAVVNHSTTGRKKRLRSLGQGQATSLFDINGFMEVYKGPWLEGVTKTAHHPYAKDMPAMGLTELCTLLSSGRCATKWDFYDAIARCFGHFAEHKPHSVQRRMDAVLYTLFQSRRKGGVEDLDRKDQFKALKVEWLAHHAGAQA
jgi:hypothetical protein